MRDILSHLLKESPEKQIVIRMQNWPVADEVFGAENEADIKAWFADMSAQ